MQPKDFDEDVASSAERGERIRKRRENKCKINPTSPSKTSAYFVAETQPLSPVSYFKSFEFSYSIQAL